ncbi:hypothetical protein HK104_008587 [Borealophlyctis nickersoniae]|nr:hypothetical protein HK104_008587 [Borealophlyctis nickersoniae]
MGKKDKAIASPQPVPTANHIFTLPHELLTQIFIHSGSTALPRTCTRFFAISRPLVTRVLWLCAKYGPQRAAIGCWRIGFFARKCDCSEKARKGVLEDIERMEEDEVDDAGVATEKGGRWGGRVVEIVKTAVWSGENEGDQSEEGVRSWDNRSKCPCEETQLAILTALESYGVDVSAGGDYALRMAAASWHLRLCEALMRWGADPTVMVIFEKKRWWWLGRRTRRVGGGAVWGGDEDDGAGPSLPLHNLAAQPSVPPPPAVQQQNPLSPQQLQQHQQQPPPQPQAHPTPQPPPQPQAQPTPQPQQHPQPQPTPVLATHVTSRPNGRLRTMTAVPLLLQAVRENQIPLIRLFLRDPPAIPPDLSSQALTVALNHSHHTAANILLHNGARIHPRSLHNILHRAQTRRLALGPRDAYARHLFIGILALDTSDYLRLRATIIRACAEIGCVEGLKACVLRGPDGEAFNATLQSTTASADPSSQTTTNVILPTNPVGGDADAWSGLPLYASVYNGNLQATRYLLHHAGATTRNFTFKQRSFCIMLLTVEAMAMAMFGVLVGVWIFGISQGVARRANPTSAPDPIADPENDINMSAPDSVTIGELTGLAVPSLLALGIMYRLVPFHDMLRAYLEVVREDKKRRRIDTEAQRERDLESGVEGP